MVIIVGLSKAYDRLNWIYLTPMLIHVGFNLNFVNWLLSCVTKVSFFSFNTWINLKFIQT